MQTGAHKARQIRRLAEGRSTRRFRFVDKRTMATIGRRTAVAELPGRIRLGGTVAWLAWLGLHIFDLLPQWAPQSCLGAAQLGLGVRDVP
jgi:NADH dehydrogenase